MNVTGYHVHVYFDESESAESNEPQSIGRAMSLYFHVGKNFPDAKMGKIHKVPVGPHTKPMFRIAILPERFGSLVSWLMLNRNELSILVHPETGDELADHTKHTLWLGTPVPLDLNGL